VQLSELTQACYMMQRRVLHLHTHTHTHSRTHAYVHTLTQVGEAPVTSRILKVRTSASGPFKPSVLSTKNVTFNFRQSLAKVPGTDEVQKGTSRIP